jgi:hypothetical protein
MRNARLINYFIHFYNNAAIVSISSIRNAKDRSIAELENNIYAKVIGKVLFIEHGYMANVCITDFTHNSSLPSACKGKFSLNMLLYINVYDKHAVKLRDVRIGDV